jgi:hypothetical protein
MKLTVLTVLFSLAAVLPASATDGASNEKKASSGSADSCCEIDAEKPAGNKDSGKAEKKQSADTKTSSSADAAPTPSAH